MLILVFNIHINKFGNSLTNSFFLKFLWHEWPLFVSERDRKQSYGPGLATAASTIASVYIWAACPNHCATEAALSLTNSCFNTRNN